MKNGDHLRIKGRNPLRWGLAPLLGIALASSQAAESEATETIGFEGAEVGEEPESLFVIEGEFEVEEMEGGKVLALNPLPLNECGFVAGPSLKGGGVAKVRVMAEKKRRSAPRFGIGLHGISGFRLRVVPSTKRVELVQDEEVVHSEPFTWEGAGKWTWIELSVKASGEDGTEVEGRVWGDGEERPEMPSIRLESEGAPRSGKATVWGTPYAGLPIYFDDISVLAE